MGDQRHTKECQEFYFRPTTEVEKIPSPTFKLLLFSIDRRRHTRLIAHTNHPFFRDPLIPKYRSRQSNHCGQRSTQGNNNNNKKHAVNPPHYPEIPSLENRIPTVG